MIEFLRYFFRHNEDGITSINMKLIRMALVLGLFVAYKIKDKKTVLKLLLTLGLILQGLLFYWYSGNKDIFFVEGLPFYHCRVAAIMMAVTFFSGKEKLAKYFAWLGIVGAFVAFMVPDPSPYLWPHITNLTYVVCHIILVISGAMIIFNSSLKLDIKVIFLYTLVVNFVIFVANFIFRANYGYLSRLPEGLNIDVSKPILFLVITSLITLGLGFLESDTRKLYKRRLAKI